MRKCKYQERIHERFEAILQNQNAYEVWETNCSQSWCNNKNYMWDYEQIFVDGLFEQYKVRELILKTKEEIPSHSTLSTYKHRFSTSLVTSTTTFRSSTIENSVMEKRQELDRQKKIEGSLLMYDYLILQHSDLKCILCRKHDTLMNAIIYDKFITNLWEKKNSQFALVPLVRIGKVLANPKFLLAFLVKWNNWRQQNSLIIKIKKNSKRKA